MTGTSDRRFTTADLGNLMDGITPGPWARGSDPREVYALGTPVQATYMGSTYRHNPHSREDAKLWAAAPDLAAELHRIRLELEERARIWAKVAEKLESRGHMSNAEVVQTHLAQITHILNGDNHE